MENNYLVRERGTKVYCPIMESGTVVTGVNMLYEDAPQNTVGEFWYEGTDCKIGIYPEYYHVFMPDYRIPREPVQSSNIATVGYDDESQLLDVEFRSGDVYRYQRVPKRIYTDFMVALSRGKFFHQCIKNNFNYVKLGPADAENSSR